MPRCARHDPGQASHRAYVVARQAALTLVWLALALGLLLLLGRSVSAYRAETRGISDAPRPAPLATGVNVDLLGVDDVELARQLDAVQAAGQGWVRQRVVWAAVEPTPGDYRWAAVDRLVAAAQARGLKVNATLVGAPAWARSREDQTAPLAPPADPTTFAHFVGEFTRRYQGRVQAVQLWDSPNLAASSQGEFIPARRYVALLQAAYPAAKASDPGVIVLGGGMGPTTENSSRNQSDVTYLDWVYRAGGRPYFDALAIKPYGFWSGPDDRRVNESVLNFSRAVLLREVAARYGDEAKPVWAVEWGWNALPSDWNGRPSPWGSDDIAVQAQRSGDAVRRARAEWPWLAAMTQMIVRPTVPPDDPVWGFTLLDGQGQPRPTWTAPRAAEGESVAPAPLPDWWRTWPVWLTLAVGSGLAAWQALGATRRLPWGAAWRAWDTGVGRLGEVGNVALLAAVAAAFAALPWPLNALLLPLLALLVARRLDLALAGIVLSAPFFLKTTRLAGLQVSLAETLTMLTFAAWLGREIVTAPSSIPLPPSSPHVWGRKGEQRAATRGKVGGELLLRLRLAVKRQLPLTWLDVSVALLLILGAVSPFVALLSGVATREFRVVILEPVLFYVVLRGTRLSQQQQARLADALVLAGVGLAVYGFLTYGGVGGIAAEGVRRLRSVYGSPNNLALTLGRIVPLLVALLVWSGARTRRLLYAVALVPILVALFLTFSTGAWLFGLPAALVFLGLVKGRRALVAALALVAAGLLALVPFASTERVGRLLRLTDAQTFEWRTLLWQSALHMIRDHPWFGVGLDNFLYEYRDTYILPGALADRNLSHPHNLVLDYWTRLGVGGVISLVVGQVAFFRSGFRLWRRLDGDRRILVLGLMASMVDFLAHGLIDNSFFLVDLAFIYMLTIGVVRNMEREM